MSYQYYNHHNIKNDPLNKGTETRRKRRIWHLRRIIKKDPLNEGTETRHRHAGKLISLFIKKDPLNEGTETHMCYLQFVKK